MDRKNRCTTVLPLTRFSLYRRERYIEGIELFRLQAGDARLDLRPQRSIANHFDWISAYMLRIENHPIVDYCLKHLEGVKGPEHPLGRKKPSLPLS